jgi:hypothetical protein
MSKSERRPRLTAARKFELYLATRSPDAPLGENLRQYGVHLDDLRAIEQQTVESSALAATTDKTTGFVQALWDASPPVGRWRYYDGMLYMLALLHASGNFRIYPPTTE